MTHQDFERRDQTVRQCVAEMTGSDVRVYNPYSLSNKTILVTGASSGIGRATAIECSRLGAKLVITGRDAGRLRETLDQLEGEGHRQILAELTADEELKALVKTCPELNGVVLCAGIADPLPFLFCAKDRFAGLLDANFLAPAELLRLLLKCKKIAAAGSVVLVSSVASGRGGVAVGNASYAASKAALEAVMLHAVRESGARRIRYNCVKPAVVNTPLVNATTRSHLAGGPQVPDANGYPLGRIGEPSDVAYGIIYLLSDAASWVTGQQLVIDGGLTV